MTDSVSLAYGESSMSFDFKGPVTILNANEPSPNYSPKLFGRDLESYLAKAELNLGRPVIVVADKTRLCGYKEYLPVLADALLARGADAGTIRFLIAYGAHDRQSDAECEHCYGQLYSRFKWIHHQCDAQLEFVERGRTRRGTPIRIRPDVMDASCLITFGAISHHYFAGYGGGRKLIFPGLGEKKAIYHNHGLFLDRDHLRLHPDCRPGFLHGNPLAEDLAEYENHRQADLAIHGILDSHGRVCKLLIGRGQDHFRSACGIHGKHYETLCKDQFDMVLASCGGFPKDINFIQSHKGFHHAAAFVKDGGWLILLAQCKDDVGSRTFLPWFELNSWQDAFDLLAADYAGNGGTALATMAKTRRIRASIVTQLPRQIVKKIGMIKLSYSKARQAVLSHKGALALIPNASMMVGVAEQAVL
ncbi:MAG: DUF2088 domain-containing protein [Desulfobacteraceae bacterium]|nr:DUF2088 domain-containing protein [Desulfobacteraceae bacterium]